MKKSTLLIFLIAIVLFSSANVYAADLSVEQIEIDPVVVVGIDTPATFTFKIENLGLDDSFEIYSLIESTFTKEHFDLSSGETKELDISVSPSERTKEKIKGYYVFDYEIKGKKTGFFRDRTKVKIIELKEAFQVDIENLNPSAEEVKVSLTNLENFNFENTTIKLKSPFFNSEKVLNIGPNKQTNFTIELLEDRTKNLAAETYDVDVTIDTLGANANINAQVSFLEKEGILSSIDAQGFIIRKKTSSKTNDGNVKVTVEISNKVDILARLFTTFSEKPVVSKKEGFYVEYIWEKELGPQESLVVVSTTNYTFPFIILIVAIIIIVLVRKALLRALILDKRVSYAKTKGGEFALKVTLRVKSGKHIDNLKITDRIPAMTKLYEKFGIKPNEINHKTRTVSWNVGRMESGEERVFSYIIYSKMSIVGQFELPSASASYERDNQTKHVQSNKTFFAAETTANYKGGD